MRCASSPRSAAFRLGLFTDTFDEINGVCRFLRDMGEQAARKGRRLTIHTCSASPRFHLPFRKNFDPVLSRGWPYYPELQLNLPPVPEILDFAQQQNYHAVHVSTPGPMGLCGWLVARQLDIPLLGTYHADYPAYAAHLTDTPFITNGTTAYIRWFHAQLARVFSRSREYHASLLRLGIPEHRLRTTLPAINTEKFNPRHRDPSIWNRIGVTQPRRLLYCGRVSLEKNLPMLVSIFKSLCLRRTDLALVVAGDGPYLHDMKKDLAAQPAYFLGYQNDSQLGPLYASADLFVFPSTTDTLGQVVMEAQASGLPVLVTDQGGPQEIMDPGVTGLVLPAHDPGRWGCAIEQLLDNEPRRQCMASAAPRHISRFSLDNTFDAFWAEHLAAVHPPPHPV